MRPAEGTPVLYGRDGSPVGVASPGFVSESPKAINAGVDQSGGSRVVLLELYSNLKQEHEALQLDYEAMAAESSTGTATVIEQRAKIASLEAQLSALTARNKELEESELTMAQRLAEAQIKRLEAERALLEASIDWRRMNAANTRAMSAEEER
ncbi:MAG: hypothetical protein R3F49_13015 [Planctomycetota bacterium]